MLDIFLRKVRTKATFIAKTINITYLIGKPVEKEGEKLDTAYYGTCALDVTVSEYVLSRGSIQYIERK